MLALFTYHISSVTLCFEGSNTGGCTEGTKVNSFEEVASQVKSTDSLILLLRQKDEDFLFESSLDAKNITISGDAQNNFVFNISSSSQISCRYYILENIKFKSNSKEQILFDNLKTTKVNFKIDVQIYGRKLISDIASLSTSKVTANAAELTIDSTFSNITFWTNNVNLQYPNGYKGTTTVKQINYDHYINISEYGDMMITRLDYGDIILKSAIKGDLVLISNNTHSLDKSENTYSLEDGAFFSISEYGSYTSNTKVELKKGEIKLNPNSNNIFDQITATDCLIDISSSSKFSFGKLILNGNIELKQDEYSSLKIYSLTTNNLNMTTSGLNMSVSYWTINGGLDGTNIILTHIESIQNDESVEIPFPFISNSFSKKLMIEAESISQSIVMFKEFIVKEIKIETFRNPSAFGNKKEFLGLVGKKIPLFGANQINISKIHTEIPNKDSPWAIDPIQYWREENALYEYVFENNTLYFVLIESPYRRNIRLCQGCNSHDLFLIEIGDVTKNDWVNDITEYTKAIAVYVNRDVEGFVMTLPKDIPKKVEFHITYGKEFNDFDESSSLKIDFDNINDFATDLMINFTKVRAIKPAKIEIDRIMISGDKVVENVDFSGTKDIIIPVEQAMGIYDLKDVKKIGLLTYFTQPIVTLHKELINFVLGYSNSYNVSGFEDIALYCPYDFLSINRAKEDETVQKLKVFLINKDPKYVVQINLRNFKESDKGLVEINSNKGNTITVILGNYNPIIINADVSLSGSDNATHIVESQEFSGKGISINSFPDTANITIPQISISSDSEFKFDHKINIGKIFIRGNSSVTTHNNTEYIMENSEEVKFIYQDKDDAIKSVIINNSLPHYIPKLRIINKDGIVYIDNYTLLEAPPINITYQIAEGEINFNFDNFHFPKPYEHYIIRAYRQGNGVYLIHEYIPEPSPSDSSSKTAAIIGGTVGGVFVIGVIGVIVFLCMRRKKFNESSIGQKLV